MNKKSFFKGASVLLIAAVMIVSSLAVTANTNNEQKQQGNYQEFSITTMSLETDKIYYCNILNTGVFFDSFEDYPDFVVDNFPPWTTIDLDGDGTYGMEGVEWPNAYYSGAFMIFNPHQTNPPIDQNHPAKTGQKYASCWDSVSMPNNDWLISPSLSLEEDGFLTFWARSLTDQYGLERMKVGVSTTDMEPASFEIISPGAFIEVPVAWTQYTYDLSAYTGETVYLAINCVSDDAFSLFIDDFEVTGVAIGDPELSCSGSLGWTGVTPGATVTGSFNVNNIGDAGTVLNWEIESYPEWGTWTFTPSSGVTTATTVVDVEVIAPDDKDTEFTGSVKVVNSADPDNYCIVDVALVTPVTLVSQAQTLQHSLVSTSISQGRSLNENNYMQLTNDILFHQEVVDSNGDWAFINCDSTLGYGGIENFQISADVPIQKVALYGIPLYHDGAGWVAFPPENVILDVVFYDDAYNSYPNLPTDTIATFNGINTFESIELIGTYAGFSAYKWTFELPQDVIVTGQEGWMQIESTSGFMWGNSKDGDLLSYQIGLGWLIGDDGDDRAMTLYGEGGSTPGVPDLSCAGSLSWADIKPGDTVNGTFTVSNVGDAGSLLNWQIDSFPEWGTWTFTPDSGVGLTPEDGAVTVTVEVVAPLDKNTEFTGQVILVNSDDVTDTCTIEVVLATPVGYQSPLLVFIQRLVQRFPLLAFVLNLL